MTTKYKMLGMCLACTRDMLSRLFFNTRLPLMYLRVESRHFYHLISMFERLKSDRRSQKVSNPFSVLKLFSGVIGQTFLAHFSSQDKSDHDMF